MLYNVNLDLLSLKKKLEEEEAKNRKALRSSLRQSLQLAELSKDTEKTNSAEESKEGVDRRMLKKMRGPSNTSFDRAQRLGKFFGMTDKTPLQQLAMVQQYRYSVLKTVGIR